MFSYNKSDNAAYFAVWTDSARDRSYLKEALRICGAAEERCVDQDLRTCPEIQAPLNWLAGNGYSGAAANFRRAFTLDHPMEREAAVTSSLSYLTRQAFRQSRPVTWPKIPTRVYIFFIRERAYLNFIRKPVY